MQRHRFHRRVLVAVFALFSATAAAAANVNTIAGTGTLGSSGDGGPAIAASMNAPHGMAVAADGTVFIADTDNYRVRRISAGGTIDTIAGTGAFGDDGDGGQATAASLSGILSLALSPAGDTLYISDIDNNRVRQLNLGTGVITNFAGVGFSGFGYDGDGGPATSAWLQIPEGVAVDTDGNVYIGDIFNCVVRKVDIGSNIITTVAGVAGQCTPGGDGGDALAAHFSLPRRMAVDASGNLFVLDTGSRTVRRIDAGTGIITTIAGGGATTPGFGDATTMDIGAPSDLVIDANDNLYISSFNRVLAVDLGSGMLSVFAGTGASGYSGDGGPAQDATFEDIGGVAARGAEILIGDAGNHRVRAVAVSSPDDLVIELITSQAFLDSFSAVVGSVLMINVDGRDYLVMSNATSVGLDITVTGNDQLVVIDLAALASVGGDITISGNLVLETIDMSGLATVTGSLSVAGDPAVTAILLSGVTSIGVDLTLLGTAATVIDMSSLATVGGSLEVSDNTAATTIDMGSLTQVGGNLSVSGNSGADVIDLAGLATVGGDLEVGGNTTVSSIELGGVSVVTGNVDVSSNTSAAMIDMSSLSTVGGSLTIGDNTAATVIDLSALSTVTGDLTVVDNGDASVDMSAGTDVGGSVTVETTGTGVFSMGDGTVTGDVTVDATGITDMSGMTPGGALDLTVTHLEAVMSLQIEAATFETPVSFTVSRVDPVALPPESGVDDSGAAATIDPIAAYQFDFAVPTLDRDATLSFDVDVAQLDTATRTAVLAALAAGTLTMATKGDEADSAFQSFPLCDGADVPTVDGCVRVETLDANGQPTSDTPAIIRFSNVVGHFSTWAVAIATPDEQCPVPSTDLCIDGTGFASVFDETFTTAPGETLVIDRAFSGVVGPATVTIHHEGCEAAQLSINGLEVVAAAELSTEDTCFTRDVSIDAANTLHVVVEP